jgi:pimeloyl-ACP methyl ester carboxylesterase
MRFDQLLGRRTSSALALVPAILLAAMTTAAIADNGNRDNRGNPGKGNAPLVIKEQGYFFVNQSYFTSTAGQEFLANQSYVEFQVPEEVKHPYPIIFFPGGGQTGTNFTGTPDGREGWARFFLEKGYAVYIVDEVGRGKAAWSIDLYGPLPAAGRYTSVEQRFTAIERFNLWPQAHLHTQWPGAGVHGDPIFDQFLASQVPSIDIVAQELQQKATGAAILDRIGPAIIVTHSMSGSYGWQIADARPTLVKGLIEVEPSGPPFYDVVNIAPPTWFADSATQGRPWGITRNPITYSPPVTSPAQLGAVKQPAEASDVSPCWRQSEPAHQLPTLQGIPIVIITSEASYHAPYDHCTSEYLTQAGVAHTWTRLQDVGIHGNGHMMMLEKNNLQIAGYMAEWVRDNVEKSRKNR